MNEEAYNLPAGIPDAQPEPAGGKGLASQAWREAESRPRITLRITRLTNGRRKIRDTDNLWGGVKPLVDCLRLARVIESDDSQTIKLEVEQKVVQDPKEVGTLVEVIWSERL